MTLGNVVELKSKFRRGRFIVIRGEIGKSIVVLSLSAENISYTVSIDECTLVAKNCE